jgi:large subunit ribosomal protein L13
MKSITSIKQSEIAEKWYLVDAAGQRIGIVASKIAELLQGKVNPLYKRYHKPSTKVVVVNVGKIDFTAKRGMTKFYKSYSGFPGGLKFTDLNEMFKAHPERPLESAVRGMLPKTKSGDVMFSNLRIYIDNKHVHEANSPEKVDIKKLKI